MGKGARIAVAAALVLALVGLATWWLLAGRGEDASLAARGDAATTAVGSLPTDLADGARGAPVPLAEEAAVASVAADLDAVAKPEPGDPVTFTGRVLDDTGRPVKDAEVVHLPSDLLREAAGLADPLKYWFVPWERLARARTDGQGRFTLPARELPPRKAALLDIDSGNGMTRGSIDGSLPRLLVLHPALEPALFHAFAFARGDADVGDLVVPACGAVAGRLLDESGQPQPGAAVRLSIGDSPEQRPRGWEILRDLPCTTTGPDGRFVLGGIWNTALTVEMDAEDFVPERRKANVSPHTTVDLGDVVLERGGEISGWVFAEGGAPIGGARITVRMMSGPHARSSVPDAAAIEESMTYWWGGQGYEAHTVSGADGAFGVGGVSARLTEAWRVIVAATGYEAALQADVKPGGPPLRFELKPAAGIRLRVLEPGGAATVPDASVVSAWRLVDAPELGPEPWRISLQATREADAWRLAGAGPEHNQAIVSAPGHATTGFELPGVAPGAALEHAVELPPEAVIAGRVVDDVGAPVEGASVRALPPEDLPVKLRLVRVTTGADGRFELRGLLAGRWTVGVSAQRCVPAAPVLLTPAAGERIEDVEFQLDRGGSLAGSILAHDARGVVGNMVLAKPVQDVAPPALAQAAEFAMGRTQAAGGGAPTTVTFKSVIDDRGEYLIEGLPAGDYEVTCHPGAKAIATVTAGQQTRLDLALHELPRLRGRVTSAGAPVENARVVAICTFGNFTDEAKSAVTNAAGEYALVLDGEGSDHGAEVYAEWKDTKTRNAHIDPKFDQEQVVDLAFGGGALQGEVVDEDGAPVKLQVTWAAEAREGFTRDDDVRVDQDTDATGHFRLDLLPTGSGVLMLGKRGYVGVTLRDLEVKDGEVTTVPRVVLHQGGAIEVHVGGTSGDGKDSAQQRYLVRVRSLVDAAWGQREQHVKFGTTGTFPDVPAGNVEIDVLKPVGPRQFELFRTVPAVVVRGETFEFDQPATE
ncbi:MAG TPA: carboxypeptidase regulatory-like domain-containing protein [Planctomycetota bacterium]|nr:carboxypeptidase regulatory-like domain-containing protein [Planctomycetota bacterium]